MTCFSASASTGNGRLFSSAKPFLESTLSTLTPITAALARRNAKMSSRISQAWVVQPGVPSFG